jgi:aldehyde:ferredoxin oxidoreductase
MVIEICGYGGSILYIDLGTRAVKKVPLDLELIKKFIGGRGLGDKLLYDLVDPNASPLAPQQPLIFVTGPLADLAPCASRLNVMARSPMTGIHGDSNVGGLFAIEMKRAGYDAIVIKGASNKPIYLWIHDDSVEFRDATHLWGKTVTETTDELIKEVGDREAHVACIGPAGEKLVINAAIIIDYDRAAAKCGVGALMGSKKLKAIVVRGTREVKVYNLKAFKEAWEEALEAFKADPGTRLGFTKGSHFLHKVHNDIGGLILKNGKLCQLPDDVIEKFDRVVEDYCVKSISGCGYCIVSCEKNFVINVPGHGRKRVKVDYYGLAPLSYRMDITDPRIGLELAYLTTELGMDHTFGQLIALAMELYEHKIITKDDLEGLDLTWGNVEAVRTIIIRTAYREGKVGELFAGGIKGIIEKYPEAIKYAIHVKYMDNIPQDPRANPFYNFRYIVSTRGATHLWASGLSRIAHELAPPTAPLEQQMKVFLIIEDFVTLVNILGVCNWAWSSYTTSMESYKRKEKALVKLYNAATGFNLTLEDFHIVIQRIILLERAENARYGIRREHDTLPERFIKEPARGIKITHPPYSDLDKRLDIYYKLRGIDEKTGIPRKEVLVKLGLEDIVMDLEARGILR